MLIMIGTSSSEHIKVRTTPKGYLPGGFYTQLLIGKENNRAEKMYGGIPVNHTYRQIDNDTQEYTHKKEEQKPTQVKKYKEKPTSFPFSHVRDNQHDLPTFQRSKGFDGSPGWI